MLNDVKIITSYPKKIKINGITNWRECKEFIGILLWCG